MPRKLELTWQKGSEKRKGRWKKFYQGKAYYFAFGESKSDMEGYRQALAEWKKKKAEIDAGEANRPKPHQEDYEQALDEWNLVLQWSLEHDDERHVCLAREKIQELKDRLAKQNPPPVTNNDRLWSRFRWPEESLNSITELLDYQVGSQPPQDPEAPTVVKPGANATRFGGSKAEVMEIVWQDRIESQQTKLTDPDRSIAANVEAFLRIKENQVRAGELSAGRYTPLCLHLNTFRDWLGPRVDVATISGKVLTDFHSELLQTVRNEKMSSDYARDRISAVKTFVRWLYEVEVLDTLPRILTNKRALTIGKKITTPETFTIDEVKTLLNAASDRTKLYLLLMLNTGVTQKDLSDLRQSEVDWKAGKITRKRSKTAKHKNTPTVTYSLWAETFRLLNQERSKSGDRVLVNENGKPLKIEELDNSGKQRKIDNVASAYSRLRRVTKIKKPLKIFRKTSASLIGGNERFQKLDVLFLGQAPSTVADKYYTKAAQELLDQAIQWLGEQYGVDELLPSSD